MTPERVEARTRAALALTWIALVVIGWTLGTLAAIPSLGLACLVAGSVALVLNGRLRLDPFAQGVGTLVTVVLAASGAAWLLTDRSVPERIMVGCALLSLAIATFRLAQQAPRYGQAGTLAVLLIPLIVAGALPRGPAYAWAIAVWALCALFGRALDDPGEPAPLRTRPARLAGLAALIGATTLLAFGLALALPVVHGWLLDAITGSSHTRSAFGRHFELGSLSRIMSSPRLALQIRGDNPGYLRGVVYGLYRDGYWSEHGRSDAVPVAAAPLAEARAAAGHGAGRERWTLVTQYDSRAPALPLPLDVARLASDLETLQRTPQGIVFTAGRTHAVSYGFQRQWLAPGQPGSGALGHPPQPVDGAVPPGLRGALIAFANRHTDAAAAPARRIGELASLLQSRFEYSLQSRRASDLDPVLDFLQVEQRGHCEYFASAMALLARALGVPARVAGGYLVTERRDWDGAWIARERDAHAWTEVWLDGQWQIVDATPSAALAGLVRTPPGDWRLAGEWAWTLGADLWTWLGDAAVWLLIGGLLVLLVWLRIRALRRLRGATDARRMRIVPGSGLVRLERALARRGFTRAEGETLHAFADRIAARLDEEIADWLRHYAHWRYAGGGASTDVHMDDDPELAQLDAGVGPLLARIGRTP